MKWYLVISFSFTLLTAGHSQDKSYPFHQLYQLDSLGETHSISRYFGLLYARFLRLVEQQLGKADTTTRRLVRHFEQVFAQFYIDACIAYKNGSVIHEPAWRAYFADSTLLPAQYYLLGANAHLNGQLAEAIAHSYSTEEWKQLKGKYYLFNRCLNETYRFVHRETLKSSKRARLLHFLSLGLDREAGNYYLYKWRKRQMRLTEYYFAGSPRYQRLYDKIRRKKERIDKMVITQL